MDFRQFDSDFNFKKSNMKHFSIVNRDFTLCLKDVNYGFVKVVSAYRNLQGILSLREEFSIG